MVAAHLGWLHANVDARKGTVMFNARRSGYTRTASDLVRAVAPSWLRIRIPETLKHEWFLLAANFMQTFCMVLEPHRPRGAILRFQELENSLEITFVISSQYTLAEETCALRSAAMHYRHR